MIRGIKHCSGTLEQIIVPPASNKNLASQTGFGETINKTLENDKNDENYLISALKALSNHLINNSGPNYSKLDLEKTYRLLTIELLYKS